MIYLGYQILAKGISTDPDKVAAVENWKVPNTVKELRSFLGFASYYRRFVKDFSKVAGPLHELVNHCFHEIKLKRLIPSFESRWNEDCQKAFSELKHSLMTAPVWGYADYTKPFILETDASHQGLGAVLSQNIDGNKRVIAYVSRRLRPPEQNMAIYSSMRLELLALKWVIKEKFRSYLLGSQFEVYTDNNPLSHLENAMLGAIEQRWVSQLASFDFKIHYRRGKSNANADALSGMMEDSSTDNFLEIDEDYIKSVCEIATSTTALLSEMKSTVKEV